MHHLACDRCLYGSQAQRRSRLVHSEKNRIPAACKQTRSSAAPHVAAVCAASIAARPGPGSGLGSAPHEPLASRGWERLLHASHLPWAAQHCTRKRPVRSAATIVFIAVISCVRALPWNDGTTRCTPNDCTPTRLHVLAHGSLRSSAPACWRCVSELTWGGRPATPSVLHGMQCACPLRCSSRLVACAKVSGTSPAC